LKKKLLTLVFRFLHSEHAAEGLPQYTMLNKKY